MNSIQLLKRMVSLFLKTHKSQNIYLVNLKLKRFCLPELFMIRFAGIYVAKYLVQGDIIALSDRNNHLFDGPDWVRDL